MKTTFKKIGVVLLALLLAVLPVLSGRNTVFATAGEEPGAETVTVTFYNGNSVFDTQTYEKGVEVQLPESYPTHEGDVFRYWVIVGASVSPTLQPGSFYTFNQDTELHAVYGDAASDSEGIYAVKDGKTEYKVVYNGQMQYVEFDAAQPGNSYSQTRMSGYDVDGWTMRFFMFDEWDLLIDGADWYVDITGLGARGRHVGRYSTTPVSGAEWCQTWGLTYHMFTQISDTYIQIAPATLIIEARPIVVKTADVDVRFGDVIPTDGNEILGTNDAESGLVETDTIVFVELTADTVGKGQENKYQLTGEGESSTDDYKVVEEELGTLDVYYEIAYDLNGGEGEIDADKSYESEAVLSKKAPTRSGYKFLGWALSQDAGDAEFQPGDDIELEGNVTLYAVWSSPDTGDHSNVVFWAFAMVISVAAAVAVLPRKKFN